MTANEHPAPLPDEVEAALDDLLFEGLDTGNSTAIRRRKEAAATTLRTALTDSRDEVERLTLDLQVTKHGARINELALMAEVARKDAAMHWLAFQIGERCDSVRVPARWTPERWIEAALFAADTDAAALAATQPSDSEGKKP